MVSSAASLPPRTMATRSQTRSTSERMCEERNTVRPSSRASRSTCRKVSCTRGSRPVVGSSRMSRAGWWKSACTRPIFCRLPRLRRPMGRSRSRPRRSAKLRRRPQVGEAAQPGEVGEQLAPGHAGVEAELAGQIAHRPADGHAVLVASKPRTCARPPVGWRRSSSSRMVVVLPAPLGPMKPKTSPGRTSRSRRVDACAAAVSLGQPLGQYGRRHRRTSTSRRSRRGAAA